MHRVCQTCVKKGTIACENCCDFDLRVSDHTELAPIVEQTKDNLIQVMKIRLQNLEKQNQEFSEALALNKEAQNVYISLSKEIEKLQAQNKKYRDALEYIMADEACSICKAGYVAKAVLEEKE